MKPDHLSYARAAQVALLGLVVQVLVGLGLLIYSQMANDHAAASGSFAVLLGAVVWLSLALTFDQHRRERLEALETEQLDQSQRTSVFAASANELKVQARRLAWMHGILIPIISVVLAGALIALAWWRIDSGLQKIGYDKTGVDLFVKPASRGWAVAIGLGLAVLGFIFGRFVSGMAKQKVWANLRAGAAYAALFSVIGLAMALAHLIDAASRDDALRYIQIGIPALAGYMGVEILISLLLNLYRPRKPGEVPRGAFDSPVMGFIASPDRIAKSIGGAISYQVGIDITGTWAYQLIARAVLPLLLLGVAVVWIMTCVTVVGTSERGIRVRNGDAVETVGPGLYFKLPWPFESIERIEATALREIELSTPAPGPDVQVLLWTEDHKVKEQYLITRATPGARDGVTDPKSADTKDIALVSVRVPLRYCIADVSKWNAFGPPAKREDALRSVAQRELIQLLAEYNEDELLGAKRAEASEKLRDRIRAAFARPEVDAGVQVLYAGIENIHPQKDVAIEFEKVVSARAFRSERIDMAEVDAIRKLTGIVGNLDLANQITAELKTLDELTRKSAPAEQILAQTQKAEALILSAGGAAGTALADARAWRWVRHMSERGNARAYAGRLAAYKANPELYKATLYFETLRQEMADARIYLVTDEVAGMKLNLKLEETGVTNVLSNPSENK